MRSIRWPRASWMRWVGESGGAIDRRWWHRVEREWVMPARRRGRDPTEASEVRVEQALDGELLVERVAHHQVEQRAGVVVPSAQRDPEVAGDPRMGHEPARDLRGV